MSMLRMPRLLVLAAALAALPAFAAQPPIQQQMSPEEFKAAGLDKLSAEELARLNGWLGRTIEVESEKAATAAKKQVEADGRGFWDFGSAEPIASTLVGEFRGFGRGGTYTLANGQVWKQIDATEMAGVRITNPPVSIAPGMMGNTWYMRVGKYSTRAKVSRVK